MAFSPFLYEVAIFDDSLPLSFVTILITSQILSLHRLLSRSASIFFSVFPFSSCLQHPHPFLAKWSSSLLYHTIIPLQSSLLHFLWYLSYFSCFYYPFATYPDMPRLYTSILTSSFRLLLISTLFDISVTNPFVPYSVISRNSVHSSSTPSFRLLLIPADPSWWARLLLRTSLQVSPLCCTSFLSLVRWASCRTLLPRCFSNFSILIGFCQLFWSWASHLRPHAL